MCRLGSPHSLDTPLEHPCGLSHRQQHGHRHHLRQRSACDVTCAFVQRRLCVLVQVRTHLLQQTERNNVSAQKHPRTAEGSLTPLQIPEAICAPAIPQPFQHHPHHPHHPHLLDLEVGITPQGLDRPLHLPQRLLTAVGGQAGLALGLAAVEGPAQHLQRQETGNNKAIRQLTLVLATDSTVGSVEQRGLGRPARRLAPLLQMDQPSTCSGVETGSSRQYEQCD